MAIKPKHVLVAVGIVFVIIGYLGNGTGYTGGRLLAWRAAEPRRASGFAAPMTTRWPRILLATLSCLLAVATSASAECAWVCGSMRSERRCGGWGPRRVQWTPLGAVATLEECEKEQARQRKTSDMLANGETKTAYAAWRCLHDAVDPRRPRGK